MLTLVLSPLLSLLQAPTSPPAQWTILIYGAVDNSAEESFVPDVARLLEAAPFLPGVVVALLVDRSPGFDDDAGPFGQDFADTRLFELRGRELVRVGGGSAWPAISATSSCELDLGDAEHVKSFLRWGKARHPARRTALVFYTHGGGWSWAPDATNGESELYPAELTRTLEEQDSVDLLVFDVCSMAGIENAYQWRRAPGRFGVGVMVATPNAGDPFDWGRILGSLSAREPAHGERRFRPSELEADEFGRRMIECTGAYRREQLAAHPNHAQYFEGEAMVCLDLARAAEAKRALDALAVELARTPESKAVVEGVRGEDQRLATMDYFVPGEDCWPAMPYFDLFDLALRLQAEPALAEAARAKAAELARAADALVLASFGMSRYASFEAGKHGLYLVFPDGDARRLSRRHWSFFGGYVPGEPADKQHFGHLDFCRDGAEPGNERVETWFELLDHWFDDPDAGGSNGYRP